MKNIFNSIITILIINCQLSIVNCFAQAPQSIPYQAVARNPSGNLIANTTVKLRFTIHDATAGGINVYQESRSATTNALGLFSVNIGSTGSTDITGTFSSINWGSNAKFMQVEIDLTNGNSFTDMGTQQMMSVPYALYAETSGSVSSNVANGTVAGQTLFWNGNAWVSDSVLTINSTLRNATVKNSLTITNTNVAADTTYSLQIEAAKPMMLPRMTQTQINAIIPVEGMTVYNTDAHKEQVYGMITNNAEILNEVYTGTYSNSPHVEQYFTSPISGQVVAIEVLVKDYFPSPDPLLSFSMPGYFQIVTIGSFPSYTWFTVLLTTPQPVYAGFLSSFSFDGPGVFERNFATNSFYPNGFGCCFSGPDDVLFRIHIQPTPGSFGWQNLH